MIDSACAVNRLWAINLTEHRIQPHIQQPLPGILDHGLQRMLTLRALGGRSPITVLRLLLHAIEHYSRPKAIRTDNESIFISWVLAFPLQWLGTRWIMDQIELQATVNMLRNVYSKWRPHQSLSGHTHDAAWRILIVRKRT